LVEIGWKVGRDIKEGVGSVNNQRLKPLALSLTHRTKLNVLCRDVWQAYNCPSANVHRRHIVSKARVPAVYAEEFVLSTTIGFSNTTAYRTGARGIARINGYEGDAAQLCLVLDKLTQLEKRPTMQCRSLSLANRYPLANPAQIFKGDSALGVFGFFDNVFADVVVYPSGKAAFFAGQFFQTATARLRALALQFGAQFAVTKAHVVHGFRRVDFARAVYRDVGHAEVNAQEAVHVGGGWFMNFAGSKQIERAANQAKVRLAALPLQKFDVALTADEGDGLATTYCPDGNLVLVEFPRQDARVVGNRAVRPKGALAFLSNL